MDWVSLTFVIMTECKTDLIEWKKFRGSIQDFRLKNEFSC